MMKQINTKSSSSCLANSVALALFQSTFNSWNGSIKTFWHNFSHIHFLRVAFLFNRTAVVRDKNVCVCAVENRLKWWCGGWMWESVALDSNNAEAHLFQWHWCDICFFIFVMLSHSAKQLQNAQCDKMKKEDKKKHPSRLYSHQDEILCAKHTHKKNP